MCSLPHTGSILDGPRIECKPLVGGSMNFPTWTLGSVRISSVKEIELPIPGAGIVPEATPEALAPHVSWLRPHFVTEDGRLRLLIQALVVESCGRRIVVDTCAGNDK